VCRHGHADTAHAAPDAAPPRHTAARSLPRAVPLPRSDPTPQYSTPTQAPQHSCPSMQVRAAQLIKTQERSRCPEQRTPTPGRSAGAAHGLDASRRHGAVPTRTQRAPSAARSASMVKFVPKPLEGGRPKALGRHLRSTPRPGRRAPAYSDAQLHRAIPSQRTVKHLAPPRALSPPSQTAAYSKRRRRSVGRRRRCSGAPLHTACTRPATTSVRTGGRGACTERTPRPRYLRQR
jgi:hypothetical protein